MNNFYSTFWIRKINYGISDLVLSHECYQYEWLNNILLKRWGIDI